MEEIQPGIFKRGEKIYTENACPGESVYGEQLVEEDSTEYREWNPHRSKAGAAVKKGIDLGLERDREVLYLGAASGTTVSHFSDILRDGFVIGIEYSDTVIRDLVKLAEQRENIAPVLSNARRPEDYSDLIDDVDVVFQDISQRDQPEIFIRNARKYLKQGGTGLFAVKARSMSSSKKAEKLFSEVEQKMEEGFRIVNSTRLDPFEKEHLFLKLKKK